ncbi:MAG TPA: class I SAM-dependent methyltransferase [Solirubrobacteraceae bacterium]|nr:class I SAM-dependent methyltransferase [Solirubrobacteraceae bacterium]
MSSETISPTAHYTGHVWARHGLSHPALDTAEGRVLFGLLRPATALSQAVGGPSLEGYLLARHAAIDARLKDAIAAGTVAQVVEIAAGMSPRGWRFTTRDGGPLTYVEADLPAMAARKRRALARIGSLGPQHRVVDLDALRDGGPGSLPALAAELDRDQGVAVITEGLTGYLAPADLAGLWRRIAAFLDGFPRGLYISDLHLGGTPPPEVRVFRLLLSAFVRGGVYLHFADAAAAQAALREAGFARAGVVPARGPGSGRGETAHILEASTIT